MIWLAVPALASACYWVLVLAAAARWRKPKPSLRNDTPISVLKPVHGRDPHFYEAIRSHALQNYPQFQILFGISDAQDPAAGDIRRLIAEFPAKDIGLIATSTRYPNRKVGVLSDLAAQARYPLLLINDSDISVPPDYLHQTAALLDSPGVGLVTCLYRAHSNHLPGQWEALGIATEFAPSVLVARMLGSNEFALGSTMLLRADDLKRIGGFAALGDYLADDYQLGCRIRDLGLRVELAPVVVETHLDGQTWRDVWRHQLRWSRTIRASRPGGYFGYLITHATFWSLMAALAGAWQAAIGVLAVRLAAGMLVSARVLDDRTSLRHAWWIPFRDLWGFAIWAGGVAGHTVHWRGSKIKISTDGKILSDL